MSEIMKATVITLGIAAMLLVAALFCSGCAVGWRNTPNGGQLTVQPMAGTYNEITPPER